MRAPVTHRETVLSDWVDYNGHMNVAYYVLIFDHATDAFLAQLGIDETYRNKTHGSVFVVESHISYDQEVLKGQEVEVSTLLLSADQKRLHLFHSMYVPEHPDPVATIEIMILHVDLRSRKSAPFTEDRQKRIETMRAEHARFDRPEKVGRKIRF